LKDGSEYKTLKPLALDGIRGTPAEITIAVFLSAEVAADLSAILLVGADKVADNLFVHKRLEAVPFLESGAAVLFALASDARPLAGFPNTLELRLAHVVSGGLSSEFVIARSDTLFHPSQEGIIFFSGMALLTIRAGSFKAPSGRNALLLVWVVVETLLTSIHTLRLTAIALPHRTLI